MGMMYLAALAAAAKKQRERENAARRRAKKFKEEMSKERKSSWEKTGYNPEYSYLDKVVFAIRTNPQLKEFFKKLEDKIQDIREGEGLEIREKAKSLAELAKKYEAEAKKIEEDLAKSGITLGEQTSSAYYDLNSFNPRSRDYVLNEADKSFEKKGFKRYTEFNGAELTMQDVCDSYNTSYEGIISELSKDINKAKATREKLQKKLDWFNKERKISLFDPDKSGMKSQELKNRISKLNVEISKLKLQKEEVSEVKWLSYDEFKKIFYSNKFVPFDNEYKELVLQMILSNFC